MHHQGEGILHYGPNYRAVLLVDQGIADYYRRLIPKWIGVNPQRHQAHITVARTGLEVTPKPEKWGYYEGETVQFFYSGEIEFHDGYYYLRVESKRIDAIRRELGLLQHFDPVKGHHITVATQDNHYWLTTLGKSHFDNSQE
jgi:hypothetical protein